MCCVGSPLLFPPRQAQGHSLQERHVVGLGVANATAQPGRVLGQRRVVRGECLAEGRRGDALPVGAKVCCISVRVYSTTVMPRSRARTLMASVSAGRWRLRCVPGYTGCSMTSTWG